MAGAARRLDFTQPIAFILNGILDTSRMPVSRIPSCTASSTTFRLTVIWP